MQVLTGNTAYTKFLNQASKTREIAVEEKSKEVTNEYTRLTDSFAFTLGEVAALDGSPRDSNAEPVNVTVKDRDKGEVVSLDDNEFSTTVKAFYANGTSHAAPNTLTAFQVDKQRNLLSVFEYGDISDQINVPIRESRVQVKYTQIDLSKGEVFSQNPLSENNAGAFLDGYDNIKAVRRTFGQNH